MASIEIGSDQLRQALRGLATSIDDPSDALDTIGLKLVESTQQRFVTGTEPDGTKWAPNKESTLARKSNPRPLVDSGILNDTIHHQLEGNNILRVGSPMEYAAAQQFGMPKGYAGTMKKRGLPIPWGDIPARPFLGLSDTDENMILKTIADHIRKALD